MGGHEATECAPRLGCGGPCEQRVGREPDRRRKRITCVADAGTFSALCGWS
jgi:hypothetical protein